MALKIQYASDLHLEFAENWRYLKENPLEVTGDILVLAGDIGYLGNDNYCKHPIWDWASENYQQVIACMGNHEFYKYFDVHSLGDGYTMEIRPNVHSYYNAVVHIQDVNIIVSTLWASIPPENAYQTEYGVADFHRIMYNGRLLTAADFNQEHERCKQFIMDAVAKSKANKKVVVTHHVPSFQLSSPDFEGSPINGAFTVEMGDYIEQSGIDCWIYGHSHRNIDKQIGQTMCVSNQLGYVFHQENKDFSNNKMIEV